jgi:hypothetical protein
VNISLFKSDGRLFGGFNRFSFPPPETRRKHSLRKNKALLSNKALVVNLTRWTFNGPEVEPWWPNKQNSHIALADVGGRTQQTQFALLPI